ncbi:PA3715 family protein [Pseudoxanthomonas wuyuanensis]
MTTQVLVRPGIRVSKHAVAWCALLLCGAFPAAAAATAEGCSPSMLSLVTDGGGEGAGYPAVSRVVAETCKVWPYDPSITLAAVARVHGDGGAEPGERSLSLDVAMLDSAQGAVLARYRGAIGEDALVALSEGALRLDTARYDLVSGSRAFGVVVHSSARGASCPDRRFNDELTLFVREGSHLRPVLVTYLDAWEAVSGNFCGGGGNGPVVTEQAAIGIGVQPTRQHGHADLLLTARIETLTTDASGNARRSTRRSSRRLRYDGQVYALDPYRDLFFWSPNP